MIRTFPHGVPCWVDAEAPDAEAAQAFYGALLGWTFEAVAPGYAIAFLDGAEVAGVGEGEPGWSTYVAVDDADAAADAVRAAGGTVVGGPADAGPGGRAVSCEDPGDVAFRLWQAKARPGVQVANSPGAWNFSDLHAAEPALDFYASVFGWKLVAVPGAGTMIQVPGYGKHLAETVDPGILERQANAPDGFEDVVAGAAGPDADGVDRWRVAFTVEDRDDAAATAERLGATIERTEDTDWTKVAFVRDPQGAVLTLSQFAPPDDF